MAGSIRRNFFMSTTPRILIVDEEPDVLAATSQICKEAGYDVLLARSGSEGLEVALREIPDLVILDVVLGDEDGVEICRRIKAEPTLRNVYVALAFGEQISAGEAAAGLDAGAVECFRRPLQSAEFVLRLRTLFRLQEIESQLRASEEHFRTTLGSIGDGVISTDTSGLVTGLNVVAESLTGWTEDEALGQPATEVFRIVNEATRKTVESPIVRALREGGIIGLANHTLLLARNGREIPIADSAAPIRNNNNKVTGVVLVFRDQTEERAAERRLQQSEARYLDLYENAPDMFVSVDAQTGLVKECNQTLLTKTGYSRDEVIGQPIFDRYTPRSLEGAHIAFQQFVGKGEVKDAELQLKCKGGDALDVSLNVTVMRDETGAVVESRSSWRDITEHKKVEAAMHERVKELRCLYGIAESIQRRDDMADVFRDSVELIPPGWHYPEITCARIRFDDREYLSNRFEDTEWRLTSPIVVDGQQRGTVEVLYTENRPQLDEGVFLKEERDLIDAVASLLSEAVVKRESESRFSQIIERAPIPMCFVNAEGRFVYFNERFATAFGYTHEDVPTLDEWWMLAHPDEGYRKWVLNTWNAAFERAASDGTDIDPVEYRVTCKNGNEKIVEISGVTIGDSFLATFIDITERKQAQMKLQQSEATLRAVFDKSPFPVAVVDENENKILWSQSARELFGHTPETISEWHECVYPDPEYRKELVAQWKLKEEEARRTGSVVNTGEHFIRCEDGRTLTCEIYAMFTDTYLILTLRDITERKQAEENHERLHAQLQQSQKIESIGRLAGGVAHDFNNMLNVILGHADFISDDLPADSPLQDSLDELRKAAEHSADLTRQLLAFARRQPATPEVLDVNETIASMLKMLKRLIGEDIDLQWQPGVSLDTVHIDPLQIDQILANLVVNSRDAIEHNHGKITIETGKARFGDDYYANQVGFRPGTYVMLAVSDNGCGMDEETRTKIFEPFFTTKNVGEGTGLGLATIYGIVKQNDGFVNVYSEPGQGTTIKIYLPCHKTKAAQMSEKGTVKPSERGHETILLVEDEPAILNVTTMMLERQGYTVLGSSTAGQAIRRAMKHPGNIHLLITDVVMPEINGRELARKILALYPDVKCLFMSGYNADIIAQHGVLDKGVNFIQKPFSKQDLSAKVRNILD